MHRDVKAFSAVKKKRVLCKKLSQVMDETWLHHSEPDVEACSGNTLSPRTKKLEICLLPAK
jgi:hypothetical protein